MLAKIDQRLDKLGEGGFNKQTVPVLILFSGEITNHFTEL